MLVLFAMYTENDVPCIRFLCRRRRRGNPSFVLPLSSKRRLLDLVWGGGFRRVLPGLAAIELVKNAPIFSVRRHVVYVFRLLGYLITPLNTGEVPGRFVAEPSTVLPLLAVGGETLGPSLRELEHCPIFTRAGA